MMGQIQEMAEEAKACGLAVVVCPISAAATCPKRARRRSTCRLCRPYGGLLGAHIIKVKPPTAHLELAAAKKAYAANAIKIDTLADRIAHVVQATFNGRRIVVFSGGEAKDLDGLLGEIRQLYQGGASGSIIGRNTFQRPREEAIAMLNTIIDIYKGKA